MLQKKSRWVPLTVACEEALVRRRAWVGHERRGDSEEQPATVELEMESSLLAG